MVDLKQKAAEVAAAGRYGDTVLIHVAPEELAGLASLMPGGKLSTNPKTGLPEAFFFLPFLAGLGGLFGAGAGAAATGALGAGMGAGMTAASLPLAATGLTAGATAAGLGAAGAGAAGAAGMGAASALPLAGAASTALPSVAGTAAGTAGSILPAAAIPTSLGGIALPEAAGALGASSALPAAATGGLGSIGISGGGAAGAGAAGAAGTGAATALPASGAGTASTLGGALAEGSAGVGASGAAAGTAAIPQSSGIGGLFGGMGADKMLQYGAMAAMMMPQGGGGGKKEDKGKKVENDNYERGDLEMPDEGYDSNSEWDYFPRSRYFSGGGLVKGYAEGGLAALDKPATGKGKKSDGDLIEATMMALMGQSPNAEAVIQEFIATFGQEALQDLISRLQASSQMSSGGQPQGGGMPMGDGMSDSVPAMISGAGGQQPAALSEGEYVVPADVVSGLGNGSTQAGANQLQGMVDRTRKMRTGGMVQPPAINPMMAMPQ